jgi:glycerol kinase
VGYWENLEALRRNWSEAKRWLPSMAPVRRDQLYRDWNKAVGRTLDWI